MSVVTGLYDIRELYVQDIRFNGLQIHLYSKPVPNNIVNYAIYDRAKLETADEGHDGVLTGEPIDPRNAIKTDFKAYCTIRVFDKIETSSGVSNSVYATNAFGQEKQYFY